VSDPVIHDAHFVGSPLISYGEAPSKKRIPKLLAFLAGSFVFALLVIFTWFWGFTSLEVPFDPMVIAIVPASFTLPPEAPEIWRNTAENNYPLPTVMGYTASGADNKPVPFALRVFSLADIFQDEPWSIWRLVSTNGNLGQTQRSTPMRFFGSPMTIFRKQAWLSLNPSLFLGTSQDKIILPSRMEGLFDGSTWEVDMSVVDAPEQVLPASPNLITLSGQGSSLVANYSLTNGIVWQLPEAGWLVWKHQTSTLEMEIYPSTFFASSTIQKLEPSEKILSRYGLLLSDGTDYQEFQPLVPSSTTQVSESVQVLEFQIPQNLVGIYSERSVSPPTCPGKTIAIYDAASLKNICSWLDTCFIRPASLVVSQQGEKTFICIK